MFTNLQGVKIPSQALILFSDNMFDYNMRILVRAVEVSLHPVCAQVAENSVCNWQLGADFGYWKLWGPFSP